MQGIEIDAEGIIPEALAQALNDTAQHNKRAVYLTPTLHNPTTATMGAVRRQVIVDICCRAGVRIIEDGVYAASEISLSPLAALAPDIALHVNGLSKSLSPGLQIGVLALPDDLKNEAKCLLEQVPMAPSALSCAVLEDWMSSGTISSLQKDMRREAQQRSDLAVSLLGMDALVSHPDAYNVWLPMKRDAAEHFVSLAGVSGIKLTAPETIMVNPKDQASGVRICLGSAPFDDLTHALTLLAELLRHDAS